MNKFQLPVVSGQWLVDSYQILVFGFHTESLQKKSVMLNLFQHLFLTNSVNQIPKQVRNDTPFFHFCFLCSIIRNCSFWITMIEMLAVRKRPFLSGVKEDTFFSSQKRKYPLKPRCSLNNNKVLSSACPANCHLSNRKAFVPQTKFSFSAACLRIVPFKQKVVYLCSLPEFS